MNQQPETKKYLFSLSIGPVQTFISQSRKVQDLYAGSKLLSDLINGSLEMLEKLSNNLDIVFPDKNLQSKPNRFICIVETDKNINEIGRNLELELKKKFKSIFNTTFLNAYKSTIDPKYIENFNNQIDDFLNIYWLAVEYNQSYDKSFDRLEKLFNSIKKVKIFSQVNQEGKKCSLCGERTAYFDYKNLHMKMNSKSESICSVCLIKRFYFNKKGFESTADIALMDTLFHLKDSNKLNSFNSCFEGIDGQLYYEENINNDYYKKNLINTKKDNKEILDIYRIFSREVKDNNKKLAKYYALINLDVDNAGDFMSGKDKIKDINRLLDYQKLLSKSLAEFSTKAKDYIQEPKGQTIYAGGDDFLAFININHLLPTMKYLKELFDIEVNTKISEYTNEKITFSMGIVISHYKLPLSEILKQGRSAVEKAKNVKNKKKNSFCISLLKHSGEIHEMSYNHKIKYPDEDQIFVSDILLDIVDYAKKQILSNTWEKSLSLEFTKLIGQNKFSDAISNDNKKQMYFEEIKRLISRSVIDKEKITKDEKESFINKIYHLFLDSGSIENFISALNISEFISREVNL